MVVVVLFTAFAITMVWFFMGHGVLIPIAMFAAIALASFFYYRRRCPECGGRLVFRRAYNDFAVFMIVIVARSRGTGER